jgi:hypothetical protein
LDVGSGDKGEAEAREAPLWVEEVSLFVFLALTMRLTCSLCNLQVPPLLDLDAPPPPAVELELEPPPVLTPMDDGGAEDDGLPADEDVQALPRPSARAIDAVVDGMHALERAAPPLGPPPPAVVSLMD